MVDFARYEELALALPGTGPTRHFRYDGFGVGGKHFVHLNKDDLFLMMKAEDAARFAEHHPALVTVLRRNDKPIGARAVLADLPEALAAELLEAAWRSAGGTR
jgi:hypothetical protein